MATICFLYVAVHWIWYRMGTEWVKKNQALGTTHRLVVACFWWRLGRRKWWRLAGLGTLFLRGKRGAAAATDQKVHAVEMKK